MYNNCDDNMLTVFANFCGTCLAISRNKRIQPSNEGSIKFNGFSLKHVYGFLLIFSLILPLTMSVPMRGKRSSTDKSDGDKPHWVNPCPGVPTSSSGTQKRSVSDEDNSGSEADFINSIVLTSKHAIYQAEKFREKYVMRTFSVDFEKHHSNWKSAKYGWLAQEVILPKELGEKLSSENLQKIELDDESIKIYGYLQRLAVAFEQVTKDQREVNSEFQEEFAVAETHLKSILCELREIIPDSKFAIYRDANRDIMPPEFRHMDDHTYRNVRDWLIFRDYMNIVEYLIQVLEYFKTKTV